MWTTRLDRKAARSYGVAEIHVVCFAPEGWLGRGPTMAMAILECELQLCRTAADGNAVTIINRPPANKDTAKWLATACEMATEQRLFVIISCDTAEQAKWAARHARRRLPQHRRMALERMYNAETRRMPGKLS
jgi:hypothetical protein